MRKYELSFRGHLTALALAVAAPFLVSGLTVSVFFANSEFSRASDRLLTKARDLSVALDRQVEGRIATLKTLSLSTNLQAQKWDLFTGLANAAADIFPGSAITVRDADGQQFVNTLLPPGTPLPRTADPILRSADEIAVRTMKPAVSDLYRGVSTNRYFVIVELPLTIADQVFLLSMAVPPDSFLNLLRDAMGPGSLNRAVILDKRFRVIARTEAPDEFIGRQASESFSSRLVGQSGILESTTLDGLDVVNAFYRSDQTGFVMVVSVPREQFYALYWDTLKVISGIGVLGVLFSLAFAYAYNRFLTPPVAKLRSDALALGASSSVLPFKTGTRELTAVSAAMASASASLGDERVANRVLINELNHRVKNTLATVQSLAAQSLRNATSTDQARKALDARLIALAKAHDILTQEQWVSADINHVVRNTLSPYLGEGSQPRIEVRGGSLQLKPRAVLALSMALHELATNAAKYGALSNVAGRIVIAWRSEIPETFELTWTEWGGPPVFAPNRRGFGSRLIEQGLAQDLAARVSLQFKETGVVCSITAPLKEIQATDDGYEPAMLW